MQFTKTVVINCAGVGSRLGLGQTKALVKINDKTLISYQLEILQNVKDLRIVVGFEAKSLIAEVLKYRKNALFVFNHDYMHTKTGGSFYLGAKYAKEFVVSWDGDLIVHPDDVNKILNSNSEFACYSKKDTDDAVCVDVRDGKIYSFNINSDFEWSGICSLKKEHIIKNNGHTYEQLLPKLPIEAMEIRSFDIDTYDDYVKASQIIKKWYK